MPVKVQIYMHLYMKTHLKLTAYLRVEKMGVHHSSLDVVQVSVVLQSLNNKNIPTHW